MKTLALILVLFPVMALAQLMPPVINGNGQVLGQFDRTGMFGNTNGANQVFLLTPITPASDYVVTSASFFQDGTLFPATQIAMGIYTAPSGNAATLVCTATILSYPSGSGSATWDATPVSGCTLTGGVTYYLAYNTNSGNLKANIQGTKTGYYVAQACCTLGNVSGLTTQVNSFGYLAIYVSGYYK